MRALSVAALLAVAGILGACSDGGGTSGGPGGGGGGDGGSTGSDLPASALQSSDGLIAYLKQLIATQTNETSEPVVLGDVTLPVSDTTEPVALN